MDEGEEAAGVLVEASGNAPEVLKLADETLYQAGPLSPYCIASESRRANNAATVNSRVPYIQTYTAIFLQRRHFQRCCKLAVAGELVASMRVSSGGDKGEQSGGKR